jgi:hypothetical protein
MQQYQAFSYSGLIHRLPLLYTSLQQVGLFNRTITDKGICTRQYFYVVGIDYLRKFP